MAAAGGLYAYTGSDGALIFGVFAVAFGLVSPAVHVLLRWRAGGNTGALTIVGALLAPLALIIALAPYGVIGFH